LSTSHQTVTTNDISNCVTWELFARVKAGIPAPVKHTRPDPYPRVRVGSGIYPRVRVYPQTPKSYASCYCCERNFEYLNWLSTRTCGALRTHVGLCPALLVFFSLFLSPGSLRGPSTDRPETLPHDRKVGALDKLSPKIRGGRSPQKWGAKTCKISGDFLPLLILIANISGMGQDIENWKDMWSRAIPSVFDEKSLVNFGKLCTENSMWVWTH